MSNSLIPVGISACLLGNQVRFDGGHKRFGFAADQLTPYFSFEPICPEIAVGLPTPRPALRLVKNEHDEIALQASNGGDLDVTEDMHAFSASKVSELGHLCGYIVCAKSPSCGMERVRVYDADQKNARRSGVGLFTEHLTAAMPWLPVEENGRLNDAVLRENFIERVFALHELNQLWQRGLTRGRIMAFHSRYKLLLLAHSQLEYRTLGRFVATMDQWASLEAFIEEYRLRLMSLLSNPATRRNHTNVLMHVQGYFRNQLNASQRQELTQLIDRYRQGVQPLLAPITLLRHYLSEYPDDYLEQQRYFAPYPEALRLRYGY
ncbi:hypothetical protein AU490_03375 [Lonsdalea populi]|uniref:DUF1722 domain-containing protein n=1 Tax=Lonsdalea populi TaxID=1172565 RepID=A0A3N0UM89_9GAMM|nr:MULTISPECIES: 2-thiouracil desulfurase family protein [Lonsdalea]RAT17345.1 hypothetical protein AU486_05040 [Lonsdalea quercina]RAT30142.1 hypothetical protein AU490_03375 [Lonsdalea populi]RAT31934.1 hypothetical protein AU491_13135 [Lonsdalea populi]RAT46646.1 hypothetical protein AU496_07970 [Lonsdalea populi]RAT50432.1 hypothetical protein AU498_13005 [Lonsdalea populi]